MAEVELSLSLGRFLLDRFFLVSHQEGAVRLGSFAMMDIFSHTLQGFRF